MYTGHLLPLIFGRIIECEFSDTHWFLSGNNFQAFNYTINGFMLKRWVFTFGLFTNNNRINILEMQFKVNKLHYDCEKKNLCYFTVWRVLTPGKLRTCTTLANKSKSLRNFMLSVWSSPVRLWSGVATIPCNSTNRVNFHTKNSNNKFDMLNRNSK